MWETCKRETRGLCFVVSFFAVANCASSVALACPEQVNKYECCINCLLTYFMFSWVHEGTSLWHFFSYTCSFFPTMTWQSSSHLNSFTRGSVVPWCDERPMPAKALAAGQLRMIALFCFCDLWRVKASKSPNLIKSETLWSGCETGGSKMFGILGTGFHY